MRAEIVKKRMKDVLRVDSITSSQGDFLATHVPFQKMLVTGGHGEMKTVTEISEEEVFQKYFDSSSMIDQHQLLIVEGSSGAGKSHFIRWICAKLENMENPDEVILLVRRSDNTLKGTIKQLLQMKEVQHIQNHEIYERLVKANQTISEQKLKYQIFHRFLVEIQSDEETSILNTSRRKGLYALLSNTNFEEHLMESGGAIERIFNKVTSSESGSNQDTVALFEPEDFILSTDFVDEMENAGADRKALKLANWLIPDEEDGTENAQKIADYMNQHVEEVIQSCAGIEPGDFQQIFKEIRQELKRQGKRLTLLIEDITSFTGINQALLDVLLTEHTGLNEQNQLCRLVSVVGTTSEYYKQFRDNYRDRITTQITIQDGAIGENELLQFVGKYLNVMSLDEEIITEWLKNGAREEEYPVHQAMEGKNWENILYKGKKLNLYPFTRNAIKNLYHKMVNAKTPRYILRDIVEPAVHDILENHDGFPAFCRNIRTGLAERIDFRIHNLIAQLSLPEDVKNSYCSRILYLIGIWGNGTLDSEKEKLGGLELGLFQELGLQAFVNVAYGRTVVSAEIPVTKQTGTIVPQHSQEISVTQPVITENPDMLKRKKEYDEFYKFASKWHYDNDLFVDKLIKSGIRDAINDYVYSAINWQQEGISIQTVNYIKNSDKRLVGFANQNRGKNDMLVTLENTEENYQLLLAFGKWLHLGKKSWDFENAETAIYHATKWLLLYRKQIVQAVRGETKIPLYLKCAMISEMYRKILNGEYTYQTLNRLDKDLWLKLPSSRKSSGHAEPWLKVLESFYSNTQQMEDTAKLTVQYFNLVQGAIVTSPKYILYYTLFQEALRQLRTSGLCLTGNELAQKDEIAKRNELIEYTKNLLPKLDIVAKAEQEQARQLTAELLEYFEYDEDDEIEIQDVRDMLEDIMDFYKDADQYGVNIFLPYQQISSLKENAKKLTDAIALIQEDTSQYSTLEILLHFSSVPMQTVQPFLDLLRKTKQNLELIFSQKTQEKNALVDTGRWLEHVDECFEEKKDDFEQLFTKFKEVTT